MLTKKGWDRNLMLSLFKKEAAYDAGVTMSNANACSMKGFEATIDWDDKVQDDKDAITGQEFGTDQEFITQAVKLSYKEPRAKPNSLIGLAALALGDITSTQDGAYTAYKHKINPLHQAAPLPQSRLRKNSAEFNTHTKESNATR